MTRNEIIAMAREASQQDGTTPQEKSIVLYAAKSARFLERFASLVAAAEREACAKVCEGFPANRDWVPGSLWGNIRSEMSAAIRARAAIAKATGENT